MEQLVASCGDVFDLVFQHFNAKDVIKTSLASKSWYEIIGSSHHCMKQIWLEVNGQAKQLETLRASRRVYENFRVHPDVRSELSKVAKKFRPKVVRVLDDQGEPIDHESFFELMQTIAPTLIDLQIGETESIRARKLLPINFPKLRELHCTAINRNAFSIFMGSNPQLENVLLAFNTDISMEFFVPTNIVHEFLQRNSQIKRLAMCEIDCSFKSDLTKNVKLDLRTFTFTSLASKGKLSERVIDNLVKFIECQRNLESLQICCLYDQDLLTRIWRLRFKKIFIMDCSPKVLFPELQLTLEHNYKVEEIDFYLNSSCHILKFLQKSPNLKTFKLRQLSAQIMRFSALHLPNLERIKYQSLENDVEKVYINLKQFDGNDINRNIKLEEINFFEFAGVNIGFEKE